VQRNRAVACVHVSDCTFIENLTREGIVDNVRWCEAKTAVERVARQPTFPQRVVGLT